MITHNGSLAIDLSTVKAIRMEYLNKGRNLVFDLNNILIPIENSDTGEIELKSFPNDPIIHFFDNSDSCIAYFEEWVELWEEFKTKK